VFSGEARASTGDVVQGKFAVSESDQSDADDEIDFVQSKWIRPLGRLKSKNAGGHDYRDDAKGAYSTCAEFLEGEDESRNTSS
jgi:hypothetical protein